MLPATARRLAPALLALLTLTAASAQTQRGMTPWDVARLRVVSTAVVSPDAEYVAYTVAAPADPLAENEPVRSELHLFHVDRGTDRVLVGPEVNPQNVQWTPEGDLSYLTKGDSDRVAAIYSYEIETGVVRRVLAFENAIEDYAWHSDGRRIAFIANAPRPAPTVRLPYRPEVVDEDFVHRGVWIAEAYRNESLTRLDVGGTAHAVAWHPGDYLAVAVAPTPSVDDRYMRQRIKIYSSSRGSLRGEVAHEGKLGAMDWCPDGEHLAFIAGEDVNDPASASLFVVDEEGGTPSRVLPAFEGMVDAFDWKDDHTIVFLASQGVETFIGDVEMDGEDLRQIVTPESAIYDRVSTNEGGDLYAFVGHRPEHPPELYLMTPNQRSPRRVTDSNPWLRDVALARQEVVQYTSRDSLLIEGLLIRPLDETPGERYPLIMVVHGGPESHFKNGWLTNYSQLGQVAAARGYAVFFPNYRGSTGRGSAFARLGQGDPAGAEFDDLVDGVDYLIQTGLVDSARVGVTGGSYGGYATAWLSTRYTERFAAGVMFVGITDLISKYGTTDIPNEEYLVHARSYPWEDWQRSLERSPIYYAEQSRTPLLILHGKDDPRVHPSQSLTLYRYLKTHGNAPVRLVLYPGEGHGNRRATARLDYTLRALQWFDHFLGGRTGLPPMEVDYAEPTGVASGTR